MCWLIMLSKIQCGGVISIIVAAFMLLYCAMIFPFLKLYATMAISIFLIMAAIKAIYSFPNIYNIMQHYKGSEITIFIPCTTRAIGKASVALVFKPKSSLMRNILICTILIFYSTSSFCQQTYLSQPLTKLNYLQKSKKQKTAAWGLLRGGTAVAVGAAILDVSSDWNKSEPLSRCNFGWLRLHAWEYSVIYCISTQ